ncbi:hypothetical protein ONZ45_g630 [Pleurotus djamor]|nr:hypothetical protein ONZ45_g630 [Pleurotus djamor]
MASSAEFWWPGYNSSISDSSLSSSLLFSTESSTLDAYVIDQLPTEDFPQLTQFGSIGVSGSLYDGMISEPPPSPFFQSPCYDYHYFPSQPTNDTSFYHYYPPESPPDDEPVSPLDTSSSTRMSRTQRLEMALKILRQGRLAPIDLLLEVLNPRKWSNDQYRSGLFAKAPEKLVELLDLVLESPKGAATLKDFMRPHALETVTAEVYKEMDIVKKHLSLPRGVSDLTVEYLKGWSHANILDSIASPTLSSILHTAAQTHEAEEKNILKNPDLTCKVLVTQLAYQRSNRSSKFHSVLGLFLWSTGCQRQTIDALFRCGLTVSYDTVLNSIASLGMQCLERAARVSRGPHLCAYDNVNISTSIHTEQRGAATPSKVQSGTFAVIYELRNARRFETYKTLPELQHTQRQAMPAGHKTKQYPLRTSTIEEASVEGNLAVHEDIYINQLKRSEEELCLFAIPCINDQSTNARIQGAKILRAHDENEWSRRDIFQLGFGLFHLCLNLVWCLLNVHRGSLSQPGSLTYFFALLDKKRLNGEHPDYYTLLASLEQVVHGLLLNAWRDSCGHSSLSSYARSHPTGQEILSKAADIILCYASPTDSPSTDKVNHNIRLLTRDLLYVLELIRAISTGDFGAIEDFLPQLAMMFRGAGSNNYCSEILHFLFNLKKVWTPENIMRDNMLVNISGLPGHAMPVDLNIEHLIGYLKSLFVAKGVYSTWDRLGDISAGISVLQHLKKEVNLALSVAYHGSSHSTPDTSQLVWKIANKARELNLQKSLLSRSRGNAAKCVTDILAAGEEKLRSSKLATFNRKIMAMVQCQVGDEEQEEDASNELPPVAFTFDTEDEL